VRIDLWALAVACVGGIALIVTGLIIGKPAVGIEGAYFNRSVGRPAFSGVFAQSGTGLLDPSDGNLWIGAGIAILVVTGLLLGLAKARSRDALSE
jgi:hypothetical protein